MSSKYWPFNTVNGEKHTHDEVDEHDSLEENDPELLHEANWLRQFRPNRVNPRRTRNGE